LALGRDEAALREWTATLEYDPEDPEAYLGRATARVRIGLYDGALLDLGQAVDWAGDNASLLARIAITYAGCLGARPDQFPRWFALLRQTSSTWLALARFQATA
jgi:tetratricopeptide (TPR) repeat protein